MAYFIVIGTNDKVKDVVDEIKKSHQLHNTVSSGCLTTKEDGSLTYKWTVLGVGKEKDTDDEYSLKDILTNHLANFIAVLPEHETPKVMLVSNYMDKEDETRLKLILDNLFAIEGDAFANSQIDIALIAYDLSRKHDVTLRPNWKILKDLKEFLDTYHLKAKLLYINNMDYSGAATNIGHKMLGRFLGHWGIMTDAGCRNTINSGVYSIGMAEYQYKFEDLEEYFELDAESALIERKLHAQPSPSTQALLDKKRCFDIDLKLPWIDGLKVIENTWKTYCDTKYIFGVPPKEQVYSLEKQIKHIVSYLHGFLKIYVNNCNKELKECEEKLKVDESLLQALIEQQSEIQHRIDHLEEESSEASEELQKTLDKVTSDISKQNDIIKRIESEINLFRHEIEDKTFKDADEIARQFDPTALVTDEEKEGYAAVLKRYTQLESFVQSDEGAKLIKKTIVESIGTECAAYPKIDLDSIGRLEEIVSVTPLPEPSPHKETEESKPLSSRKGCAPWSWVLSHMGKRSTVDSKEKELGDSIELKSEQANIIITEETANEAGKAINALKTKIPSVKEWWNTLHSIINSKKRRLEECSNRINSYKNTIPNHSKSRTLIDINKVNSYRFSNHEYKQLVQDFLSRWFDSTWEKRTLPKDLTHDKIINQLKEKYSILAWNDTNPFVVENLSNDRIHQIVEHVSVQSKPFVQYENVGNCTITNQIADFFFFNNPNINKEPVPFRNQYYMGSQTLCPKFLPEFYNSLCAVQVIEIKNAISDVKDFMPKREAPLSKRPQDPEFNEECRHIIGEAQTKEEIARRIYDWLCDNIQYDTTKNIHDADTCWRTRRGVCQAYCELFCYMAETVGLTTDIITGITKDSKGTVSKEKHSWIFVYNQGYDGFFVDPTWGAGSVDGVKFVRNEDNSPWFHVSPYRLIFTHYPDQQYWLKLGFSITEEQFKKLPYIEMSNDEEIKNTLFELLSDNP